MDAHLKGGDRVNATLEPISVQGNTITLRKFAAKPWTITDFINDSTISTEAAALIWLGVQYELSTLISGGTATGKTSMLNVVANFFPPNQRIISIEDTREIQLPKFLHWVPMVTRLPNPEGKGEVSMLDLLVNSLRMRPDRIIVGEIRRKREAEVLFEAIHTGHSVYATVHANDAHETITRLTNPPIEIPKTMLPAISMIVVQYRNRRTGVRKTFQIAEIMPDSEPNVLLQLNIRKGVLQKVANSKSLMSTIEMFTGFTKSEITKSLNEKAAILKWMVKHNVNTVDTVGRIMAEYYTNEDNLMSYVNRNKSFGD
jgi:flagellar protein FlaI